MASTPLACFSGCSKFFQMMNALLWPPFAKFDILRDRLYREIQVWTIRRRQDQAQHLESRIFLKWITIQWGQHIPRIFGGSIYVPFISKNVFLSIVIALPINQAKSSLPSMVCLSCCLLLFRALVMSSIVSRYFTRSLVSAVPCFRQGMSIPSGV